MVRTYKNASVNIKGAKEVRRYKGTLQRPTIIPSRIIWKRTEKEKGQGSIYAIAFLPHSLQPEGGRRHVTLNCCIHRQDRITSQHRSTKIPTTMKILSLLCVTTCLNFLFRYGYACENILACSCLS